MQTTRGKRRPWIAYLVALLVGTGLAWNQVVGFRRGSYLQGVAFYPLYHLGWPLVYCERRSVPPEERLVFAPRWQLRLAANLVCCAAGTACVAALVRRLTPLRMRYRLSSLLLLMFVVPYTWYITALEQRLLTPSRHWGFYEFHEPHPWLSDPQEITLGRLAAVSTMACTTYLACLVVLNVADRWMQAAGDIARDQGQRSAGVLSDGMVQPAPGGHIVGS